MGLVQVQIASRIIRVEPIEGDPFLVVEIDIGCPICGVVELRLAGHHLRTVRDVIIEAIDQYPELTKCESQVVDRYAIRSRAPGDPTSN